MCHSVSYAKFLENLVGLKPIFVYMVCIEKTMKLVESLVDIIMDIVRSNKLVFCGSFINYPVDLDQSRPAAVCHPGTSGWIPRQGRSDFQQCRCKYERYLHVLHFMFVFANMYVPRDFVV